MTPLRKIGYLVTGLALGLTISVASPAVAQSVKSITAKLNTSVSVLVNGEEVNLNAQPINYNNLNYLPIGEIGRALGMNVSYDKKTDEILITNPNTSSSKESSPEPGQPSKPTEPIVYKEELKLGDSVEFGDIKLTINGLFSEPNFMNYLYYGIDYQIESLSDSTDGIYMQAEVEVQSGKIYHLNYENTDKILKGSPIKNTSVYKGTTLPKEDLPVKIKIKLTSYTKTMDVLGYATWSL